MVGLAASLAAACAFQLGYWYLPFPIGIVDVTLFVSGAMVLLLGIGTVAWLADFFLVRRAISREHHAVQHELHKLIETIFTLVQPVIRPEYGNFDDTEVIPAGLLDKFS